MKKIVVSKPSEIRNHFTNIAAVLAEYNLKEHGVYRCTVNGEKVEVKVK